MKQAVCALRHRRGRLAANRFVVEGTKCIAELLASGWNVERLFLSKPVSELDDDGAASLTRLADAKRVPVCHVSDADMRRMSSFATPSGAIAVAELRPPAFAKPNGSSEVSDGGGGRSVVADAASAAQAVLRTDAWLGRALLSVPALVYLDALSDPGNVGAIIRSCEWFGVGGVLCSETTADPFSAKSVQASMGSIFRVPVEVCDLRRFLDSCADLPARPSTVIALGSSVDATDLYSATADLQLRRGGGPFILVVGSEHRGITPDVRALCAAVWTVPAAHTSGAESLNAAVAASIALAELARRSRTDRDASAPA